MRRIDLQPITLDVRPIELQDEPGRADALAAANGRDLVAERINIVAGLAPSSVSATPLDYDRFGGTVDELRSALSWRP